jgi:hypothetical protein
VLSATGGMDDQRGWPSLSHRRQPPDRAGAAVPHPSGDGVLLGGMNADRGQADAVVSLCQAGREDFPEVAPEDHLQVWLADHPGGNSHPHFVIDQAARAVARFRAEGKRGARGLPCRAEQDTRGRRQVRGAGQRRQPGGGVHCGVRCARRAGQPGQPGTARGGVRAVRGARAAARTRNPAPRLTERATVTADSARVLAALPHDTAAAAEAAARDRGHPPGAGGRASAA